MKGDDSMFEDLCRAMELISQDGRASGHLPCPRCGKQLAFAGAKTARALRAKCETPYCLEFMG